LKWSTHTAIAKAISSQMRLVKSEEKLLAEGSVDPDRNPDRYGDRFDGKRMPHHAPTTGIIMDYIWDSRSYLLMGQRSLAMLNLGRALHYVQDRSVGFSSWGEHDRNEAMLGREEPDMRAIKRGIRRRRSSPGYLMRLVKGIRPSRKTSHAMSRACFVSAAIVAAVLELPNRTLVRTSLLGHLVLLGIALSSIALGTVGYLYLDRPLMVILCPFGILILGLDILRSNGRKERALWSGASIFAPRR